jgi:hypothetical protein
LLAAAVGGSLDCAGGHGGVETIVVVVIVAMVPVAIWIACTTVLVPVSVSRRHR